ncbi:13045_t:CDS:2 [Racocetra fulgida]|uniref:13045_t:CDS:1 n=1 Tax=Racocetra fulgida TaxID=60492 RepID=A0A9N8VTT1_9GLOM|nr:13045_t:CDS:2 [Racocetra fulgida]
MTQKPHTLITQRHYKKGEIPGVWWYFEENPKISSNLDLENTQIFEPTNHDTNHDNTNKLLQT